MKTKEQIENKILSLELMIVDINDELISNSEEWKIPLNRQISNARRTINNFKWVLED